MSSTTKSATASSCVTSGSSVPCVLYSSSTATSHSDGSLSPGASPPLILALLSIGLFVCSMIGVFGWRRIHYIRGIPPPQREVHLLFLPTRVAGTTIWTGLGGAGGARAKSSREIGKRPKLWDLKTTLKTGGGKDEVRGWDGIMPVAATIMPNIQCLDTPKHTKRLTNTTVNADISDTAITSGTIWNEDPILDRPSSKSGHDFGGNADNLTENRIQVVVAIAMPDGSGRAVSYRTNCDGNANNTHGDNDGINSIVYTLGLYEGPWKHDEG